MTATLEAMHEDQIYRRFEVITRRRRRRDWTAEQKAQIVTESFRPGANISEVARRHEVDRGLLGVWRRQARVSVLPAVAAPLFATVQIEDGTAVQGASVADARKADAMLEAMVETVREGDADRRVEAIPRRRRDWTAEQKARIVAESSQRGANISEVARRHEVDLRLLGVWRRQARVLMVPAAPAPLFAAAQIEDGTAVQGASVATAREADAMLEDMLEDMHEGDAHRRVEVITRRRPDWTVEQKARIEAESFQPGANIPEVARLNGIDRGLLGVWRRQARAPPMSPPPAPLFGAVQI